MEHKLKIDEKYWRRIDLKVKTFELRKNDRDYQVGDTIQFMIKHPRENVMHDKEYYENHSGLDYWLPKKVFKITYVLQEVAGLEKGYCLLNIKPTD